MQNPRIPLVLTALALALPQAPLRQQERIKGQWFTDPEAALAAAEKVEKPLLAVAMDHG